MRILKEPKERKNEILDTAEHFFTTKGYTQTTIMDILHAINIAKGTFYHYFKSKEEVMNAIIDRVVTQDVVRATEIASDNTISPVEKIFRILMEQKPAQNDIKDKLLDQFHQPNNADMHQRSIVQSILRITPVLAKVVQEGVDQGIFTTKYPNESIEILIASGQTMFDTSLFQWTPEELAQKVMAFISTMEILLGAEKGSFACMVEILMANSR